MQVSSLYAFVVVANRFFYTATFTGKRDDGNGDTPNMRRRNTVEDFKIVRTDGGGGTKPNPREEEKTVVPIRMGVSIFDGTSVTK